MNFMSILLVVQSILFADFAFSKSDCFDLMEFLKTKKQNEDRGGPPLEVILTDLEIENYDDFGKIPQTWLERFAKEVKDVGLFVRKFYVLSQTLNIQDCKQTNGSKIPFSVRSYTGNAIEFHFDPEMTFDYFKPRLIDQAASISDFRQFKQSEDQFRFSLARSIDLRRQSVTKFLESLRFSMKLRKDENLDLEVNLETGDEEADFLRFHSKGVAAWGERPKSVVESLNVQNFNYLSEQISN